MVEGIVVISVMLGFLGLIQWVRMAYGTKLDMQQTTRSDVLYNASHACEQGSDSGGQLANPPGGGQGPSNGAAQYSTSWNVAKGALGPTAVNFTSSEDQNAGNGAIVYGRRALSTQVKARSTCVCNEKKYDSQLTAWLSFGLSMIGNAGGFASLLSTPF